MTILDQRRAATSRLLNQLLDRAYTQETERVVAALTRNAQRGIVAQRLRELEAEVGRLRDAGLELTPDNAVLTAVRADLQKVLRDNAVLVNSTTTGLQERAVSAAETAARQLSLPGFLDDDLAQIGVLWRTPDPEAVAELVRISGSTAWAAELERYGVGILDDIQAIAIRGIVLGTNPLAVGRQIADAVAAMPVYRAQTLMRTVQLTSYRRATQLNYAANSDILSGHRRIAALDDRVCLCCIALHGTVLRVDEAVVDHHNGRCTSIAIVRGMEAFSEVESGVDWFAGLPMEKRLELAGPGAVEMLDSGKATLRDFVQPYTDPVFGEMVREASLKGIGAKLI